MKFPTIAAFNKHLKEAYPRHLAPVFLIATSSDYERRMIIDKVTGLILAKDPFLRIVRLSGLESSLELLKQELLSPSLWGGMTLVICDHFDKMKQTKELGDLLTRFPKDAHLILGASTFKPVGEFYQKGKKETVVLDMGDEKPWEKERRLQEWIVEKVKDHQKSLALDVAPYLIQHLGADLATLDQELAKLLCYCGERSKVELADVKAICGTRDLFTGWQLAEKIVWERPTSLGDKAADLGFTFLFIGQLRYHLQLGYQLAELLEKKGGAGDLKHYFPSLRPQQFEKFTPIAKARKTAFFKRGLQALYDLEVTSKSSPLDQGVLFDHFQAKIYTRS